MPAQGRTDLAPLVLVALDMRLGGRGHGGERERRGKGLGLVLLGSGRARPTETEFVARATEKFGEQPAIEGLWPHDFAALPSTDGLARDCGCLPYRVARLVSSSARSCWDSPPRSRRAISTVFGMRGSSGDTGSTVGRATPIDQECPPMSPIWPNCGHSLWSCSSLVPGELVDAVTPGQPGVNTDERPRWRRSQNADRASRAGNSGTCLGRNTRRRRRPGAARLAHAAGTYQLAEQGAWLGRSGAAGLEPVAALWQLATTTNPDVAMKWWTRRPYSALLACGTGVNGVEVPAAHGQRPLGQLSPAQRGPVVVTPFGEPP